MPSHNTPDKSQKPDIPLIGLFLSAFLSSSCCLVQLALSALSVSCVGFKVLTPYKSFLWATSAAFGWVWWRNTDKKMSTRGIVVVAVVLLALSEEALTKYNSGAYQGGNVDPTSLKHMLFEVPKMHCQACAAKVKKAVLAAYPKGEVICSADVRAKVLEVESTGDLDLDSEMIKDVIQKAGYESERVNSAVGSTDQSTEL